MNDEIHLLDHQFWSEIVSLSRHEDKLVVIGQKLHAQIDSWWDQLVDVEHVHMWSADQDNIGRCGAVFPPCDQPLVILRSVLIDVLVVIFVPPLGLQSVFLSIVARVDQRLKVRPIGVHVARVAHRLVVELYRNIFE